MKEWKSIPGYDGLYLASSDGRIYSIRRRKELKRVLDARQQRYVVTLGKNNHQKKFNVAWLVASAFLGERPVGYDVHHKNGNRMDDSVGNLEYKPKTKHLKDHSVKWSRKKRESRSIRPDPLESATVEKVNGEMTQNEFVQYLRREVERFGTQREMAKHYGIHESIISQSIYGKTPPSKGLLKALRFKKLIHYVPTKGDSNP